MGSESLIGVGSKPETACSERPAMAIICKSEAEWGMASSRAPGSVGAARATDEDETASVARISDELVDESLMLRAERRCRRSLWW